MADEINFTDLAALTKIGPDTVVEKFGGLINSSFFDATNLLGTLKQKRLIDFTTSFPGTSAITVTDLGRGLLKEADEKAKESFDHLDFAIISQIGNGKKSVQDVQAALNVRAKDLAMRLYKLSQTFYLTYEFKNGLISLALTEKGFLQIKTGMPKGMGAEMPAGAGMGVQAAQQMAPQEEAAAMQEQKPMQMQGMEMHEEEAAKDLQQQMVKKTGRNLYGIAILILVVLLLIAYIVLNYLLPKH